MILFSWINAIAKRGIAYPLAIIGLILSGIAGVLIRTAAWLVDVEIETLHED